VDECKPLAYGVPAAGAPKAVLSGVIAAPAAVGRGLYSLTSQLNLSALYGIGGALRGCLGGVWEVLGGITCCLGCILCKKRLKVSREEDECKPLTVGEYRFLGQSHYSAQATAASALAGSELQWSGVLEARAYTQPHVRST